MKKTLLISIIATSISILSVNAGGFSWGVSIGIGHPVVYTAPVVYVQQPVVYAHPVTQPVVVYVPQPVVYVQQPVVYAAPVGVIWVGGHHHHGGGGHYRGRR
jgi:hypothetical protein